jgi:hypothetical protein
MTGIELKFECKDSLLARVWHSIELHYSTLHARSRLFRATLMGQSY